MVARLFQVLIGVILNGVLIGYSGWLPGCYMVGQVFWLVSRVTMQLSRCYELPWCCLCVMAGYQCSG